MTREDFIKTIENLLGEYIFEGTMPESNSHLRVNPLSLGVSIESGADYLSDIADNEEAIEDASAADGLETEDATDWQSSQNPDFYPVRTLVTNDGKGKFEVDKDAVAKVADNYRFDR